MEQIEAIGPGEPVPVLLDVAAQFDRMATMFQATKLQAIEQARLVAESESLPVRDAELVRRSFRAEVALALGVSERAAEGLIADAQDLHGRFAATGVALAEGRITFGHARVILRESVGIDDDELCVEVERRALLAAGTLTPGKLAVQVRRWRGHRDPAIAVERHRLAVQSRRFGFETAEDGMAFLYAKLPAPEARAIFDRIDGTARTLKATGDGRLLENLRADVFCDVMLERHATEDRYFTIDPIITVTVPVLTMLGKSIEPAELDGYGPIDLATAAGIMGSAKGFRRVLTDPHTGIRLSYGREKYSVDPDLRRWLRLRDGTCRFPNCSRAIRFCDLDHTIGYAQQGRSDDVNLGHLCRGHHTLKTVGLWHATQPSPGVLHWTTPHGRHHTTHPDNGGNGTDPPG